MLNLLVGVIFDNFQKLKQELENFGPLRESAREWIEAQRKLYREKAMKAVEPPAGYRPLRVSFFWLVKNTWFDTMIGVAITANILSMAVLYYVRVRTASLRIHLHDCICYCPDISNLGS